MSANSFDSWAYFRNKQTGEYVMTLSRIYEEHQEWERTTRAGYDNWMDNELAPADEPPAQAVEAVATLEQWRSQYWEMKAENSRLQLWVEGQAKDLAAAQALEAENATLRAQLAAVSGERDEYGEAIDILLTGMDFDPESEIVVAMSAGYNTIIWADNKDGEYDLLDKVAKKRAGKQADGEG